MSAGAWCCRRSSSARARALRSPRPARASSFARRKRSTPACMRPSAWMRSATASSPWHEGPVPQARHRLPPRAAQLALGVPGGARGPRRDFARCGPRLSRRPRGHREQSRGAGARTRDAGRSRLEGRGRARARDGRPAGHAVGQPVRRPRVGGERAGRAPRRRARSQGRQGADLGRRQGLPRRADVCAQPLALRRALGRAARAPRDQIRRPATAGGLRGVGKVEGRRTMKLNLKLRLGLPERLSLLALVGALAFSFLVVKPLEERSRLLLSRIHPEASGANDAKVAEVYRFLKKDESATDWLAKLYSIGHATGVDLQSAKYSSDAAGRIERYQIVLPVSGSYTQLRDFLKRATAEIPVLSVDQMSLKRDNRADGAVQAELRLTLHMVRS